MLRLQPVTCSFFCSFVERKERSMSENDVCICIGCLDRSMNMDVYHYIAYQSIMQSRNTHTYTICIYIYICMMFIMCVHFHIYICIIIWAQPKRLCFFL